MSLLRMLKTASTATFVDAQVYLMKEVLTVSDDVCEHLKEMLGF
jgi:hypothetical protein